MSVKKQFIIFIIILIPIIISIRLYWINQEFKTYISSGSFRRDLEKVGKYSYIKNQDILSGKYNDIYSLRSDLIKEGKLKGKSSYIYKKAFGNFKIEKRGNNCYIYNLDITELLRNRVSFIAYKGFTIENYNSKLKCSSTGNCNIYLTEKGLLNINDNYSCK